MYVITKTAAWWDESQSPTTPPPRRITRWADRPLIVSRGTCLALRQHGEDLRVLVQGRGERQWLPVARVLGEAELTRWLQRGFTRGHS